MSHAATLLAIIATHQRRKELARMKRAHRDRLVDAIARAEATLEISAALLARSKALLARVDAIEAARLAAEAAEPELVLV